MTGAIPAAAEVAVRHKAFHYQTHVEWRGNRVAELACEGKRALWVSSPPEFKGDPGAWSPEDLFVGGVNVCLLMTLVSVVEKRGIPVEAYTCEAEGRMEFVDRNYRFTQVILRPRIVIKDIAYLEPLEKALEDAHRTCIVANSIRGAVILEPAIEVGLPDAR